MLAIIRIWEMLIIWFFAEASRKWKIFPCVYSMYTKSQLYKMQMHLFRSYVYLEYSLHNHQKEIPWKYLSTANQQSSSAIYW